VENVEAFKASRDTAALRNERENGSWINGTVLFKIVKNWGQPLKLDNSKGETITAMSYQQKEIYEIIRGGRTGSQ